MNFFKTVVAVLVAQVLLVFLMFVGFGFFTAVLTTDDRVEVADGSWLVVDIHGEILPYDPPETIANAVFGVPETLQRILSNLEKAAVDDRIAGVILKVSSFHTLGLASMEEIRGAIDRIQANKKPVIAFSDGLDRNSLFLASACDSIFIPAVADVQFTGVGATYLFLKGTLDKLGITHNLHQIKDYKTAAETVTREDMSPESEEMTKWLIDEVWDVELGSISRDRSIPMDSLVAYMDQALFTADEAKAAGLVDDVRYWDELEDDLKGDEEELATILQEDYAEVRRGEVGLKGTHRIAVVHAYGFIGGRQSRSDPSFGVIMGHESVTSHLRDAGDDDRIDALVFRVDSGGGVTVTSEIIAREVARIADKKPVVVSMGDAAASGGYAISLHATKLVADSLTFTGSIGSIYGKLNVGGLYNKLGITFDSVTKGSNALLWSDVNDFSEEQWKRVAEHHNAEFDRWLRDISQAREIPMETLRPLTDGRVWTGRQAKANGLVDEVGGLTRAIEIAKEEAGIPADEEVTLVHYPKRRGLYNLITSGDAPLAMVRWALYRFLHEDVAESVRMLGQGDLRLWVE